MRGKLALRAPLFRKRGTRRRPRLLRPSRRPRAKRAVRPGSRRRLSAGVLFFIALGVFLLFFLWAESRMSPTAEKLAKARIHIMATDAVNDAVEEELAKAQIQYEDMVYFEKDLTGKITALKTNMVQMNRLKAGITKNITGRILQSNGEEIYIPLGNIINGELMAGRGPRLPVKITSVGTVDAQYTNSFEAAGINQTRHQIWMEVTVSVDALLPLKACQTTVETQVILAETVIVGEIPDSFTQFGSGEIFESARQYQEILP